jgi:hypothetical protein
MRIQDVTFEGLTEKEKILYDEYQKICDSGRHNAKIHYKYPDRVRYCMELFPGNYLDPLLLKNKVELKKLCNDFLELLNDKNTGEKEILNYINVRKAYHLIGSIQKKNFNFGHQGTYIFPELELGTSHRADFIIIGLNSDGFHFVFVEFESPYGKIKIDDGDEGEVIRKGLNQVEDWDRWLDGNFSSISEVLEKYKHPQKDLPREFYKYDKTRFKYVVVAGRREDFTPKLRWKRRKLSDEKKIFLMHYDNLINYAIEAIGQSTY